jgi:hypothetical protein
VGKFGRNDVLSLSQATRRADGFADTWRCTTEAAAREISKRCKILLAFQQTVQAVRRFLIEFVFGRKLMGALILFQGRLVIFPG